MRILEPCGSVRMAQAEVFKCGIVVVGGGVGVGGEMLLVTRRLMGAALNCNWTGFGVSRRLGIKGVGDVR